MRRTYLRFRRERICWLCMASHSDGFGRTLSRFTVQACGCDLPHPREGHFSVPSPEARGTDSLPPPASYRRTPYRRSDPVERVHVSIYGTVLYCICFVLHFAAPFYSNAIYKVYLK